MHDKMSVSQMREFVKKFAVAQQEHQSLRTHTAIAEKILEFTAASGFRKRLNAEQSKKKISNPKIFKSFINFVRLLNLGVKNRFACWNWS